MKTKLLLLGATLVFSCRAVAQSDIPAWQAEHPELIFIEKNDLPKFDPTFLALYERQVIVFSKAITQADIDGWILREKTRSQDAVPTPVEQQDQLVKNWLGENPDVKLVPFSAAQQMTDSERSQLSADGALFLIGEKLTVEDIHAYSH